jgi:hypothetical protein
MATTRRSPTNNEHVRTALSYLEGPATNGWLVSQKLALQTTRFWARRLHAYADQMEEISRCSNPDEFMTAQRHFLERMRADYVDETSAFADIFNAARDEVHRASA